MTDQLDEQEIHKLEYPPGVPEEDIAGGVSAVFATFPGVTWRQVPLRAVVAVVEASRHARAHEAAVAASTAASAAVDEPDAITVAEWLADASASPRYTHDGGADLIVSSAANVEHAYRSAMARSTAGEHEKLRGWRDFLLRNM